MFESFKQLKQLKELQGAIQKEEVEAERSGVVVVMNGAFEVKKITIPVDLSGEKLETIMRDTFNDAVKKAQQAIAGKFAAMQK